MRKGRCKTSSGLIMGSSGSKLGASVWLSSPDEHNCVMDSIILKVHDIES